MSKWFWLASSAGLLWNVLGVAAFVVQMTADLTALPDAERAFYENTPGWATAAFAVAVAGGTLGCVALLLRKSWAAPMLILCLLAIVVQTFHSLAIGNGLEVFGPEGLALPALTFIIGVLLVVLAHAAAARGWLT